MAHRRNALRSGITSKPSGRRRGLVAIRNVLQDATSSTLRSESERKEALHGMMLLERSMPRCRPIPVSEARIQIARITRLPGITLETEQPECSDALT